jgi:two-component system cell cycle response regulator
MKGSVLIVDDDIGLLDLYKSRLSLAGYECTVTTTGVSAYKLVEGNIFDIAMVDIVLPDINGLELTEKIKRIRPEVAVIIMTSFIEDYDFDSAVEAGASDFIKKPFTLKELLIRIKQLKIQEDRLTMLFRDDLTGLYNRRGFFTLAEQLIKRIKRQSRGCYLFYIDLDYLKSINDTWGHHEGDIALITIGDILKKTFRESDIIARIGGDEFIVFPVGNKGDNTENIVRRLHKAVDMYKSSHAIPYEMSISVGMALFDPDNPRSVDKLLAQADRAMYKKKNSNRPRYTQNSL